MFSRLIAESGTEQPQLRRLRWYLQRHVDVDGGSHGPMSAQLFRRVCLIDSDVRVRSVAVGLEVLRSRAALWDAVLAAVDQPGARTPVWPTFDQGVGTKSSTTTLEDG